MSKEKVFLKIPENFQDKVFIHPPLIKEVVGNDSFPIYRHLLTISQEELEDEYIKKKKGNDFDVPTPLEFLLANSYHDKNFEKIAKEAFYFFTKQKVDFLYEKKLILIGDIKEVLATVSSIEELVFIDESCYFDFQNGIRESLGEKPIEKPNPNEHPKIKRMKALARYRDKVKAKQGGGINLLTSLVSICCMGLGITPLNIGEMSYASIGIIMNTYQNKEKYGIDVASLQAGANPKKIKPKYWIKNLD